MIKDIDTNKTGSIIQELREKEGVSCSELAKSVGVSAAAVTKWEEGGYIKTENLYSIATFFNITVSELINGELNEKPDLDYFKQKYSLDKYSDYETIEDFNKEELLKYIKTINAIKRYMFDNYIPFVNEELDYVEKSKVKYLSKYFVRFINLQDDIITIDIFTEYEYMKEWLQTININDENRDDVLSNVLFLKTVSGLSSVLYCDDINLIKAYLSEFSQRSLDETLTSFLLKCESEKSIEESPAVKALLDLGACVLFNLNQYAEYDESILKDIDGIIIKLDRKSAAVSKYLQKDKHRNSVFKTEEHDLLVDYDKTKELINLVYNKTSNPVLFLNNLRMNNPFDDENKEISFS